MDGLAGIKIYQKYTVDSDFLPTNYPETMDFIIKGVSNQIQNNIWTTTVESLAIPRYGSSTKAKKIQTINPTDPIPKSRGDVTPTLSSKDKRNIIKDYGWPILVSQPSGDTFFGEIIANDPRNVYKRDEQYITKNVVSFTFNSQKKKGFKLTFKFHKALVFLH